MSKKPARLDPNLMEYLCLWLPKVFAPIHQKASTVREKAFPEAGDPKSSKVPPVVEVSIYESRAISDTPLDPEATAIFFSHYAHLFISDINALNDLAMQVPSRLDYLLPRVLQLIPQPALSSLDAPVSVGVAELTPAERDVLDRLYWPKDRKVVEHEKQFWAREHTEDWKDFQSRKEGFQKAQKRWRGWAEEYFVTRWWALISDFRAPFIEAVALGVAAAQRAHNTPSEPVAVLDAEPVEPMASVDPDQDPYEEAIKSEAFHTKTGLGKILNYHRTTLSYWQKRGWLLPAPNGKISCQEALEFYRGRGAKAGTGRK